MKKICIAVLTLMVISCFIFETAHAGSTLLAMRTQLRTMLYDTISDNYLYSDATLNASLCTAVRTLVDMTPKSAHMQMIYKTASSVNIGSNYVTFANTPRTIFSVAWGGVPAIQIPLEQYFTKKDQATWNDPMYCFHMDTAGVNLIMEVFPYCTASTQSVEIIGLNEPFMPTSDLQTFEVQTRFNDLLLNLAAYDVLSDDGQSARAANFEKKIANYIQIINNQRNNQGVVEPVIQAVQK